VCVKLVLFVKNDEKGTGDLSCEDDREANNDNSEQLLEVLESMPK
jgi:hypothetical protein